MEPGTRTAIQEGMERAVMPRCPDYITSGVVGKDGRTGLGLHPGSAAV